LDDDTATFTFGTTTFLTPENIQKINKKPSILACSSTGSIHR